MKKILALCATLIICAALLAPYSSTQTTKGVTISRLDASKITSGTLDAGRIPALDASKITSGTLDVARLGSGSPSSSNFLRGDGTWASASWDGGTVANTTTFDGNVTFNSNFLVINAGAASQPLSINRNVSIGSSKALTVAGSITGASFMFPGGASWTTNAGAPSGSCQNSSIYTRSDGGASTTLYICVGGSWVAK